MPVLAIDIGGTKIALAVITANAEMLLQHTIFPDKSKDILPSIRDAIHKMQQEAAILNIPLEGVGVCVPGIYNRAEKTVWVPNIPGWENYALYDEIKKIIGNVSLCIESDRTCYIMGEHWQGAAKGCTDAIYLAIGTGIGAGIMCDGKVIRGANDIAGAAGWMLVADEDATIIPGSGNIESIVSGEGMVVMARRLLQQDSGYSGVLRQKEATAITAYDLFAAYTDNDELARRVLSQCVIIWGKTIANLVSLFNPQKIILGGGVFGPAVQFIPAIIDEAKKWAQPISMQQVSIEASALGKNAGLLGAALLALQAIH
jgi:glucokinase